MSKYEPQNVIIVVVITLVFLLLLSVFIAIVNLTYVEKLIMDIPKPLVIKKSITNDNLKEKKKINT